MENIYKLTIEILKYVLTGEYPDLPNEVDFTGLYKFAEKHHVENMLFSGLTSLNIALPSEVRMELEEVSDMAITAEAMQAIELEALEADFEDAGIDRIVLKGSVVKYFYPMPDYRQSSDIDILIKPEQIEMIEEIMLSNGYTLIERDTRELHYEYNKPPHVRVELHERLVEVYNRSYQYFSRAWDIAKRAEGFNHKYELSPEDFYVFIIAHLAKHIHNGGAGIKFITDIWILQQKYSDTFDRNKLDAALRAAKVDEFESIARALALKWFSGEPSDDENVGVLEKFVLESGSYGTIEQKKQIRASEATDSLGAKIKYKIKWICRGTFLPYSEMSRQYPFIVKYKFMYPVTWFMRIVRMLTKEDRTIGNMLSASSGVNESVSKPLRALWETVKEV